MLNFLSIFLFKLHLNHKIISLKRKYILNYLQILKTTFKKHKKISGFLKT